jgi:hypothetical protein
MLKACCTIDELEVLHGDCVLWFILNPLSLDLGIKVMLELTAGWLTHDSQSLNTGRLVRFNYLIHHLRTSFIAWDHAGGISFEIEIGIHTV